MQHALHCWSRSWLTNKFIVAWYYNCNLCHHCLADGLSTELHQYWLIVISGGTIPKNHESIIEPLMELRIDHCDIEVL